MKQLICIINCFLIITGLFSIFSRCTKSSGKNPALAYSDPAILDSCLQPTRLYYKNDPITLLSGGFGPHGTFKLRFNTIAAKALTEKGKLPTGKIMPEGSLVIKDVYRGSDLALFAYMYKVSGSWLWGEIKTNGEVQYSVNKNPATCTNCHTQEGNRDLLLSFYFY